MAVREALAKVEEYNAAMELPYSGLLGIKAYLDGNKGQSISVAVSELRDCAELCRLAELTLSGEDIEAVRANAHLYSAIKRIIPGEDERRQFRNKFAEFHNVLQLLLDQINGEATAEPPSTEKLRDLAEDLQRFANRVKREIPRDAYLTSLTSATQPGPFTRRR
jgi:hypothetical protein